MSSYDQEALNLDFLDSISDRILSWLEANARGCLNAKKRRDIAAQFGISDREVSQITKDLIEVHGIMITTGTTGIFMPQTFDEFMEGRQAIIKRIKSLVARVRKTDALIKHKFDENISFNLFDLAGDTSPSTPDSAAGMPVSATEESNKNGM